MIKGLTYSHEHINIDLSDIKANLDCKFDDTEAIKGEFKQLYELGVRTILDMTTIDLGRNVSVIENVSKETGINVLVGTGYYKELTFTEDIRRKTVEEISSIFNKEILEGIDSTSIKASYIGEIGTSKGEITENERKVFVAAARSSRLTNAPIFTHTSLGTMGLEQVELLTGLGVKPSKIVIGHVDLSGDINYIKEILSLGVNVAFDTAGKNNYTPDENRISMLRELIRCGFIGQLFMSMDITRNSSLKKNNGLGYAYLMEKFIPSAELTEKEKNIIMVDNPLKLLSSIDDSVVHRLEILESANVISHSTKVAVINICDFIAKNVTGNPDVIAMEMMGSHIAMAFTRITNNEQLMNLDQRIYDDIVKDEVYSKVKELIEKMKNLFPVDVPEGELRYFEMHTLNILKGAK